MEKCIEKAINGKTYVKQDRRFDFCIILGINSHDNRLWENELME